MNTRCSLDPAEFWRLGLMQLTEKGTHHLQCAETKFLSAFTEGFWAVTEEQCIHNSFTLDTPPDVGTELWDAQQIISHAMPWGYFPKRCVESAKQRGMVSKKIQTCRASFSSFWFGLAGLWASLSL